MRGRQLDSRVESGKYPISKVLGSNSRFDIRFDVIGSAVQVLKVAVTAPADTSTTSPSMDSGVPSDKTSASSSSSPTSSALLLEKSAGVRVSFSPSNCEVASANTVGSHQQTGA